MKTLDTCLCFSASEATNFEVDQSVFEIPESYHVQDNGRNVHLQDEDYEIMQFAIQQSLLESSRSQVGRQPGRADASLPASEVSRTLALSDMLGMCSASVLVIP